MNPTPQLRDLVPPGGWLLQEAPRLSLTRPARSQWGRRFLLWLIQRVGKLNATHLWLTLFHNLRLMRGFVFFSAHMMPFGELSRRDTELMILRTGWNCRSRYEWGQHVDIGLRAGLTEADIVRITQGPTTPGWTPKETAMLLACDEFHSERLVRPSTWGLLQQHFSHRHLVELLMLIGFYQGLAGVLNTVGIPLDADLESVLEAPCPPASPKP